MENLSTYIAALRPILYIQNSDFRAIDDEIAKVAGNIPVYEFVNGLGHVDFKSKVVKEVNDIGLTAFLNKYKDAAYDKQLFLVLKNIHSLWDGETADSITALLSHIAYRTIYTEGYHATVFIVSGQLYIPPELEHLITMVWHKKPEQPSIETIIRSYAEGLDFKIEEEDIGNLAITLKGLSFFQIKQILDLAYTSGGMISYAKDKHRIKEEKKQLIKKSGLLEFIETELNINDEVGGLEKLKDWLEGKASIFRNLDQALKAGVDRPRGLLILGLPGCGKSLTAKTTASLFEVPLLRLDVGRLLGKYVGESEANMRDALNMAEAVSPCILWLDEIEKAFAGTSDGSSHEVTTRLIGQFLTWMQEKTSTVFTVATANNIAALPPEFLRKGRFDEIFSVDWPTPTERLDILKLHLKKRKQKYNHLSLGPIIKETDKFSGADLEAGVALAVEQLFLSGGEKLTNECLAEAFKNIKPLSAALKETMEKQEERLKAYNIRPAS